MIQSRSVYATYNNTNHALCNMVNHHHVIIMWSSCYCHVRIMRWSCEYPHMIITLFSHDHVMIMWSSCYSHVIILWGWSHDHVMILTWSWKCNDYAMIMWSSSNDYHMIFSWSLWWSLMYSKLFAFWACGTPIRRQIRLLPGLTPIRFNCLEKFDQSCITSDQVDRRNQSGLSLLKTRSWERTYRHFAVLIFQREKWWFFLTRSRHTDRQTRLLPTTWRR